MTADNDNVQVQVGCSPEGYIEHHKDLVMQTLMADARTRAEALAREAGMRAAAFESDQHVKDLEKQLAQALADLTAKDSLLHAKDDVIEALKDRLEAVKAPAPTDVPALGADVPDVPDGTIIQD